jgi:TetR/AcrR family transcriptional regulator
METTQLEKDTRQLLIDAAKSVFARQGYDGATVKDIVDAAGVNVSLVSYYFKGKEGLYQACFEEFGKGRLAVADRMLNSAPTSLEDFRTRLVLYAEEFFQTALTHPDTVTIVLRECTGENPLLREIFKETFLKAFGKLVAFIDGAQKAKIVRSDFDPFISAGLFFGSLIHWVRSRGIQKEFFGLSLEDANYREKVVMQAVEVLVSGTKARDM